MRKITLLLISILSSITYIYQAQNLGVGQLNPTNTLHITPVNIGDEPLRIDGMQGYLPNDTTLLITNTNTGVIRYIHLAQLTALIGDNGLDTSAVVSIIYNYGDTLLHNTSFMTSLSDSIDTDVDSITLLGTLLTVYENGTSVNVDLSSLVNDADSDPNNELQDISTDNTSGNISLSNGSTLTLNVDDADNDPTNEIELPATGTANDVLTWNGTAWVAQANDGVDDLDNDPINEMNTNFQVTATDLEITDAGSTLSVPLSSFADADSDPTNEIELPATGAANDVLTWNGTAWVAQANDGVDDLDNDPNNELQNISGSGLSSSGILTIGIQNGTNETVDLSSLSDHDWYEVGTTTAPDNINDDIFTSSNVGIGTNAPNALLHVSGGIGDAEIILEADTDNIGEEDNPTLILRQDGNIVNSLFANNGNLGDRYLNSLINATFIEAKANNNNTSIQFVTGSSSITAVDGDARMTIMGDGKVGVGLINPLSMLHVSGDVRIGEVTDDNGSTASEGSRLYFSGADDWPSWNSDNSDAIYMQRYNSGSDESQLRINIGDGSTSSDKLEIGTTISSIWTPRMIVDMVGRVGIGTTSPEAKLDIHATGALIQLENSTTNHKWEWYTGGSIGNDGLGLYDRTNTKYRIAIMDNGDIGMGTTAPITNFHVVGNINGSAGLLESHVILFENENSGTSPDLMALKVGNPSPGSASNFITFFNGNNTAIGRIEGNSSSNTTYITSGSDFAEWLPKINSDEYFEAWDIVGVFEGKISKNTEGAQLVSVISDRAGFLGNAPETKEEENNGKRVAFIGQVPVKIIGIVNAGDYITPSGNNDGIGIAVKPSNINKNMQIVGIAWESNLSSAVKPVNVAIGMGIQANKMLQKENEELKKQMNKMQDELEAIKKYLNIK